MVPIVNDDCLHQNDNDNHKLQLEKPQPEQTILYPCDELYRAKKNNNNKKKTLVHTAQYVALYTM